MILMPSPSQELFFGSGGHHVGLVEAVLAALTLTGMSVGLPNPIGFIPNR
jgi:hypothetical protein